VIEAGASEAKYQVSSGLSAEERAELVRQVEEKAREMELADPDAGESPLNRTINRVVEAFGVAILGTIASLVFANAFARYTMSAPIIWADELIISMIPWLAMIGLFLSIRRRRLIRTGVFLERLPPDSAAWAKAMGEFLSAAAFAYLAYYAFRYLELFGGDPLIYLALSKGVFHSALCLGAALIAVAFIFEAAKSLKRRRQPIP
jgi:TRAP-type C4-dicarboxylate transport system permease small subunit